MNKEVIIATRMRDNGIKGIMLVVLFSFLLLKSCFGLGSLGWAKFYGTGSHHKNSVESTITI